VDREDDKEWPEPDRVGRQELEVVLGDDHISFTVRRLPACCGCEFVSSPFPWR
jgi:hypothetical protein